MVTFTPRKYNFLVSVQKGVKLAKYPLSNKKVEEVNQKEEFMVCLMMNISFLNCLMPQGIDVDHLKMTDPRSHKF